LRTFQPQQIFKVLNVFEDSIWDIRAFLKIPTKALNGWHQ